MSHPWQFVKTIPGHSEPINAISVSPDGRTLATASKDRTIGLWNLQTHQLSYTLCGHAQAVYAVAFSPDYPYWRVQI
ncbi:hypothetical protein QM565_31555 [Geitlerinema splendidum]|nr:hypothetical protein [Geitlerinema splendidum]